jgi:hypothetical protein
MPAALAAGVDNVTFGGGAARAVGNSAGSPGATGVDCALIGAGAGVGAAATVLAGVVPGAPVGGDAGPTAPG